MGGLAHVCSYVAVEAIKQIPEIQVEINLFLLTSANSGSSASNNGGLNGVHCRRRRPNKLIIPIRLILLLGVSFNGP